MAVVVFFIISLWLYLNAKKQNQRNPGSVNEMTLKIRKMMLITSSIMAGVLVTFVLLIIILLYTAVAFM